MTDPLSVHEAPVVPAALGRVFSCSQRLFSVPRVSVMKRFSRHVDTDYMCTYYVHMNVTLSIDEQVLARARKRAEALGTTINQLIREYLQKLAGSDDAERSIQEFRRLSGRGHSRGWRFDRDEIHERS